MQLSNQDKQRYARHLVIPQFGEQGQMKLKQSRILVIGAGGLGSPILLYLAAAGVGTIGIVEFDSIDRSNLQRQVLYKESEVGLPKIEQAKQRILEVNSSIQIHTYPFQITAANALSIISQYDVVVDGTDNFPTRYLVNDACVLTGKPLVYGSIHQFEGQVAVFNHLSGNGLRSSNYRDLFPTPPPPEMVPNCAEGGVLGVLPGIIGSMQANEALKIVTGIGQPLIDRIFIFDAANFITRTLKIRKNDTYQITQLIDYDEFCGIATVNAPQEIDVLELKQWQEDGKIFQLIDVRERHEYELDNIEGLLCPLSELKLHLSGIRRDIPVVVHCQTGKRSLQAINQLSDFDNLINLRGGLKAWRLL